MEYRIPRKTSLRRVVTVRVTVKLDTPTSDDRVRAYVQEAIRYYAAAQSLNFGRGVKFQGHQVKVLEICEGCKKATEDLE